MEDDTICRGIITKEVVIISEEFSSDVVGLCY